MSWYCGSPFWKKRVSITKVESFDAFQVRSIWESRFTDWVVLPSCGVSGGLLSSGTLCSLPRWKPFLVSTRCLFSYLLRGKGNWWFSSVYGPSRPRFRQSFLNDEIGDLWGLLYFTVDSEGEGGRISMWLGLWVSRKRVLGLLRV